MRNELAGILIDFAERADNNGEDVASVECSKGRLEWTHLTICAIPDDFWRMSPIEAASSLLVVPPDLGSAPVNRPVILAVALLVGAFAWLHSLDLA